jgi:hypothetical protein
MEEEEKLDQRIRKIRDAGRREERDFFFFFLMLIIKLVNATVQPNALGCTVAFSRNIKI